MVFSCTLCRKLQLNFQIISLKALAKHAKMNRLQRLTGATIWQYLVLISQNPIVVVNILFFLKKFRINSIIRYEHTTLDARTQMSRNAFRLIKGVSTILKIACANELFKVSFIKLFIKIGFDLVWSNPVKDF